MLSRHFTHENMNEQLTWTLHDELRNKPNEEVGDASILEDATVPINHFHGFAWFIFDSVIMALLKLEILKKL